MRTGTVSYKLEDLKKGVIIPIGFVGENDFTKVFFDAEEIYKKYPSASVSMKVQPPKGGIYPATVTRDGNTVIWQVKEADVANRGGGELQLTFTDGETKIKTYIARTDVKRSLAGNGPAPDPVQDWIDDAEEVLDDLDAMDTIAKNAQAGDIGKALSPKTVEDGVVTEWQFVEPGAGTDDYADLDNKPSIAGVTLSGNKTLEDLGIAADDDLDNLAAEVSDVKTAIHGVEDAITYIKKMNVKASDVQIATTNGYINADTGALVGTEAGKSTDYIGIPSGCVSISGKAFLYHEYGVAFYNTDKTYISGVSGYDGSSATKPQMFEIDIPENAVFIRWSLATSDSVIPDDFAFAYNVLSTTKNIVISKAGSSIPLGSTDGYINATTGALASSGAAKCTDYVEIPSSIGGTVKGKACLYNDFGVAFYDYTKVFISGVSGTSSGSSSLQPQDFNITIPETAKFMRWCLVDGYGSIPANFAVDFTVPVQTNIVDVTNEISVLQKTKLNASNGTTEDNNYWITTEYIQVTDVPKVSVQVAINEYTGIAFYDENKTYLSGVWGYSAGETSSLTPKTKRFEIPENVHFIRCTLCTLEIPYTKKDFGILFFDVDYSDRKIIQYINGSAGNEAHNILILGDSYSRLGDWVKGLKSGLNVAEIVNLGIVSATVRDRYADRTTYPYTSRPTSSGTGNQNTLASQIQKLKRLVIGTDLDAGEVKLYTDHTPDVIIIEGGMNDWYDNETKENAYPQQFITQVNGVYYKNSAGTVTQGNYHIKTDIETVDRTSFAGAYRYIVEELLTLFPDAQIFIVTASRFNYFVDNPQVYDKIAEQQIKCARYCAATVIDWNGEGNISTITDYPTGSGTQDDPYTVYGGTKNTTDGLHPNARGGRTYGRLAANVIKQRFLNIGKNS